MVNGRARVTFRVRPGANTRTTVSIRDGARVRVRVRVMFRVRPGAKASASVSVRLG